MKKIIIVILLVVPFVLIYENMSNKKEEEKKETPVIKEESELRGVFISYMELNTYIKDKTKEESKKNIDNIVKNIKDNNLNTVILQVRSHDDAIYKSNYFKTSDSILLKDNKSYDVLEYFIKRCRKENIDLFLWINPYRITARNKEITETEFAHNYLNTDIVKKIDEIYYYNPASDVTINHIIDGIKELVKNYKFKGILFDDYFYPSDDIDTLEYQEYLENNESITIKEYHLNIINNFIKEIHDEIKKLDKNILFGISPDGNIENNYNKNYADVKLWCKEDSYIDFIMPQLYYGFNNENKPFVETANTWANLVTNSKIKLYFALAFYKVGTYDKYAGSGTDEWVKNSDIIKKQIIISRNISNYNGFALFRYDNLFNKEIFTETTPKELDNLKSTLKK